MIYDILIAFVMIWFIISFVVMAFTDLDFSIFNPIRNYNKWDSFNWFGIGVITTLLNIILMPMAILYWIYKIVELLCVFTYWLFSVGRK